MDKCEERVCSRNSIAISGLDQPIDQMKDESK